MKSARIVVYSCILLAMLGGVGGSAWAQSGYLLGWGLNGNNQAAPTPVDVMSDVDGFSGGTRHSLAAKNARAWAWGLNDHGQSTIPVAAFGDVVDVAAGGIFSLARKSDGQVVAWGAAVITTNLPASVASGVTQMSAGEWHALALKDGGVIAWGSNTHNQCTVPVELESGVAAVAAGGNYSMALKDGAVHVFGIAPGHPDEFGIRSIPPEASSDVTAIAAGRWHALALKDGGVMAWGAPQYDATNVPPEATSDVVAISAGDLFSMALKDDGSIVIWGDEFNSLSPAPSYASTGVTAISAGGSHALALCSLMPPRFVGSDLLPGYIDIPYAGSVTAAADPAATYHKQGAWGWIELDGATGEISGTPLAAGSYSFTVVASNVHGQVTNNYTIPVFTAPQQPPGFVTESPLPVGVVGAPYSLQIVASNDPVFSVALDLGGSPLPAGLTLSAGGLLSGVPTTTYDAFFWVRATNTAGSATRAYSIVISQPTEPPVFYTDSPLPSGVVDTPYFVQIVVSNNPVISLLDGTLPGGLGLTAAGAVTGTPTHIQSAMFTVRATNVVGSSNRVYEIEIFGPPVFLTESPLPDAILDEPYSLQIEADGDPDYELFSGALPGGMDLSVGGLISGTPTVPGPFTFTVRATNDYGWSNREFSLNVEQIPVFSTTSPLLSGMIDEPYSLQFVASGSPTFSLFSGSLPVGLGLSGAGLLDGTPTQAGVFLFTVRATNDFGWSNREFELEIEGYTLPRFLSIRYVNGDIRLDWENLNPGMDVQVWRSTTITVDPVPWSNLGVQDPPWTNATPPMPSYYQLRLAP